MRCNKSTPILSEDFILPRKDGALAPSGQWIPFGNHTYQCPSVLVERVLVLPQELFLLPSSILPLSRSVLESKILKIIYLDVQVEEDIHFVGCYGL